MRRRLLSQSRAVLFFFFFFFNDTATTEIYTLSLHDALPISTGRLRFDRLSDSPDMKALTFSGVPLDRKSTRLNSSHTVISYAVFCLKKKKCTHKIFKKKKKNHIHKTKNK